MLRANERETFIDDLFARTGRAPLGGEQMKSVTVQLPDDVYNRAERRAEARGGTLGAEIVALIQRFSAGEQAENGGNANGQSETGFHLDSALRELALVAEECKTPGWDGAQAAAVSAEAARMAERFLTALPPGQPIPSIGAEPDGHVTLEWHQDARRTLSVSINAGPEVHYAALLGQRKAFGQELFQGEVPLLILELMQRIRAQ